MQFIPLVLISAAIAPALGVKTWDVNIINGMFSPKELTIASGDTAVWPMTDSAPHMVVKTTSGARSCNSMAGGLNSGPKSKDRSFEHTFSYAAVVSYNGGTGNDCMKRDMEILIVGYDPAVDSGTET
ncbi:hypothetical protein BC939DRAFT_498170 [Gamsiella multidivaricata]|uniref:uncharacterized protein n=1 Tax=Gamsiella multidivaricata TaxID=101098 RepID=UPI0022207F12|nr:uncharacterized protein BC939DRAFT_498170 [Gamsiella multidivaricata]KAG0366301.1 hypothetical protein BGZ54_005560 [Gamsiella multidivaricata]KAI7832777.1 hypothetical protein BC939DRAFT_498170 [Gamsiella multidivaricata]